MFAFTCPRFVCMRCAHSSVSEMPIAYMFNDILLVSVELENLKARTVVLVWPTSAIYMCSCLLTDLRSVKKREQPGTLHQNA